MDGWIHVAMVIILINRHMSIVTANQTVSVTVKKACAC